MSWLQFLYTRLNLNDLSPKVISDYTNVLKSDAFLSFLQECNIKYRVTNKIPEMVNARSSGIQIILTNQKEIPAFIKKEFTHKQFTFADLPLNGQVSLFLKDKTDKEIVAFLNYVYSYDQHLVITKDNLKQLCEESLLYSFKQELEDKLRDVRTRIVGEATTQNILNLGRVWGRVMYLSNKINSAEYLNLFDDVDNFSNTFFLSGKIESAFYASTPKNPKTVDRILSYIKKQ